MIYQPQTFRAPDGTELVVMTRADYDRLVATAALDEDARDNAAAAAALAESDARFPLAVVDAILAGLTPVAAWRRHRGLSQSALARYTGLTQAAIARLESRRNGRAPAVGRLTTRRAIAAALDIPLRALDPPGD
jgi:hypothetical protein